MTRSAPWYRGLFTLRSVFAPKPAKALPMFISISPLDMTAQQLLDHCDLHETLDQYHHFTPAQLRAVSRLVRSGHSQTRAILHVQNPHRLVPEQDPNRH